MKQASMISFNHIFLLLAIIFILCTPLIYLITDSRRETKTDVVNK